MPPWRPRAFNPQGCLHEVWCNLVGTLVQLYRFVSPLGNSSTVAAIFMALSADTAAALAHSKLIPNAPRISVAVRSTIFCLRAQIAVSFHGLPLSALRLRTSTPTVKFLRTCRDWRSAWINTRKRNRSQRSGPVDCLQRSGGRDNGKVVPVLN
jgi:hypothetical protein